MNLARGFRGGERQTFLLVRELRERGVRQTCVVRRGDELERRLTRLDGVDVIGVGWPYLHAAPRCRDHDVMHAHDGKAPALAALAAALARAPYVVTRRIRPSPGAHALGRRLYGKAAGLVAVSEAVRERMAGYTGRSDVRVIPSAVSGLEVDPARVAELRARHRGRFVVVCAAALVEGKGQAHLIEAARTLAPVLPDLTVVLLGSGASETRYRELARGLDSVEFGGFVDDLGSHLAAADAFVLPSLSEGLGSVLLDAQAAGLPVVATRIPGVTDIVRHEDTGLLVPSADAAALAQALTRLHGDPGLREALGRRARDHAADYSAARMADRYLALYREVAAPSEVGA